MVRRWRIWATTAHERVGDLGARLCGVLKIDTPPVSIMGCVSAKYWAGSTPVVFIALWFTGKVRRPRDEHVSHIQLGGCSTDSNGG